MWSLAVRVERIVVSVIRFGQFQALQRRICCTPTLTCFVNPLKQALQSCSIFRCVFLEEIALPTLTLFPGFPICIFESTSNFWAESWIRVFAIKTSSFDRTTTSCWAFILQGPKIIGLYSDMYTCKHTRDLVCPILWLKTPISGSHARRVHQWSKACSSHFEMSCYHYCTPILWFKLDEWLVVVRIRKSTFKFEKRFSL